MLLLIYMSGKSCNIRHHEIDVATIAVRIKSKNYQIMLLVFKWAQV